jgi:FkbM family methyltransferase
MSLVVGYIQDLLDEAEGKSDFFSELFGEEQDTVINGHPIVLFGAGALGKEMLFTLQQKNIYPVAFCDNNPDLLGQRINGLPVINLEMLLRDYSKSYVVICISGQELSVSAQLKEFGFNEQQIFRKDQSTINKLIAMYAMVGTQSVYCEAVESSRPQNIMSWLEQRQEELDRTYHCYEDQLSKDLFVTKLAVLASDLHFYLFKRFMLLFSEPTHEFGLLNYPGTPEDYYYFNNDVLSVDDNEIYVDVGAFDGDSIETFIDACNKNSVSYKQIFALEPDPDCFTLLDNNYGGRAGVSLHKIGLWSESKTLEFVPSTEALHDQAGTISDTGSVKIEALTLDDFLSGEPASFIKMDPSCDVEEVMKGAAKTISKYKPKLALGIYHSLNEFINVPQFIKSQCSEYKLYLRHNTYHLCDTDLYGYVHDK